MTNIETFRQEVRDWLETNCPLSMRTPYQSEADQCWGGRNPVFQSDDQRWWFERMTARGWTVPQWPRECGGGGLSVEEAKILREEMARINARPALASFGIDMLGPALLKYGSKEQQQKHLLKIARGEIRWCQGYSEPNAGSDLASVQTEAKDIGDYYRINGSKIWTSNADKADWIFCLVRTDTDALKHKGISFVLFDMQSPGVSTVPIKLISGQSPFCQTFFDDVKVPKANLVGPLNKGWDIAKYLLTHEREAIGEFGLSAIGGKAVSQTALDLLGKENGKLSEPGIRSDLSKLEMDTLAFSFTIERLMDEAHAGQSLGAMSSLLKYYGTELNKSRYELLMSINGCSGLSWESEQFDEGELSRQWLRTKGNSIEGGTSEVQLNIIAKRILELPS